MDSEHHSTSHEDGATSGAAVTKRRYRRHPKVCPPASNGLLSVHTPKLKIDIRLTTHFVFLN